MKNIKILLLCYLLSTTIIHSYCQGDTSIQTSSYDNLIAKVDSLKKIGNLNLVIENCLPALQADSCNPTILYNLAAAYSLTGEKDSAFYYLGKTIPLDSSVKYLTNPDFYPLLGCKTWDSIREIKIGTFKKKEVKISDFDLAKRLWEIKLKDQACYYQIGINPDKRDYYWKIKDSLNTENLTQIITILDNNSWPKQSKIGEDAAFAVFLVIQHADLIIQEKYLPLMEIAVDENEAKKSHLAYLVDRINIAKGRKQIYGTQMAYDNTTESVYFDYSKLEDPKNVNIRRKEMDLSSIEKYVAIWDIQWNPPN